MEDSVEGEIQRVKWGRKQKLELGQQPGDLRTRWVCREGLGHRVQNVSEFGETASERY